jgi:hypothetical protein
VQSWKTTPWQTLIVHAMGIYLANGDSVEAEVQRWIDKVRGKDDDKLASLPPVEPAPIEVEVQGRDNRLEVDYLYDSDAPDTRVRISGDGNDVRVNVGPRPEEGQND